MNVGLFWFWATLLVGLISMIQSDETKKRCFTDLYKAEVGCIKELVPHVHESYPSMEHRTLFECCYFAKFRECLERNIYRSCYSKIEEFLDLLSLQKSMIKDLNQNCGNRSSHLSPSCLMVYHSKESPWCVTSVLSAFNKFYPKLKDHLYDVNDFRMNSTLFNCCYFANFSYALHEESDKNCSSKADTLLSIYKPTRSLYGECAGYSYESPSCLVVYQSKESPLCATSVPDAFNRCYPKLQDNLDFDEEDFRMNSTIFNCCYFANFSYCLHEESDKNCSSKVDTFLGVYEPTRSLYGECAGYSHEDPPCFMVYNTITSLFIGGALLSLIAIVLIRYILIPLFIYCCTCWCRGD